MSFYVNRNVQCQLCMNFRNILILIAVKMLKQLSFNVFLKQAVPSITFVELNDNYLLA